MQLGGEMKGSVVGCAGSATRHVAPALFQEVPTCTLSTTPMYYVLYGRSTRVAYASNVVVVV